MIMNVIIHYGYEYHYLNNLHNIRGSHIEKLQTRGQKVGGWVRGKFSQKVTLCKI